MRFLGWLLLIGLVVGFVWAVGWGPLKDDAWLRSLQEKGSQPAPAAAPPGQEPEEKAAAEPAPVRRSRGTAAALPAEAPSAPPEPPPVPETAPPPPKKFPTAAELPVGMRGSIIEAAFGPPVAKTTAVDQSGQIEVFIYRRSGPDAVTFVHLRNGKVISANTTLY
jgi:hypothetical protein